MTAVSLLFECCLVFARLSFDRRSTVVRPSFFDAHELECKSSALFWNVQIYYAKIMQKNSFFTNLFGNSIFL